MSLLRIGSESLIKYFSSKKKRHTEHKNSACNLSTGGCCRGAAAGDPRQPPSRLPTRDLPTRACVWAVTPSRLHASRTPAFFTSNMPLTESPVWMQVITCASSLPTDSWRTLRVVLSTLGGIGSVLATTTCRGGVACREGAERVPRGCREGAAGEPRRRREGAERAYVGCRACAEQSGRKNGRRAAPPRARRPLCALPPAH